MSRAADGELLRAAAAVAYYGDGSITVTVTRGVMSGVTPSGHEPLTPAVLHVLLALADGPLHGYAIMQRVEEDSGVQMGPGTVYGSVQRLETQGLVRESPGEEDGRRRIYEITEEGRAALSAEAVRLRRLNELVRARRVAPGAEPA